MRDLPSDPIEAFLKLEETARDKLDNSVGQLERTQYMNAVIAIAENIGLDFLSHFTLPTNDALSLYQFAQRYDNLLLSVDRFLLRPDLNTDREKETSLQCVTEG